MVIDDARPSGANLRDRRSLDRPRWSRILIGLGIVGAIALVVAAQLMARHIHALGPLSSLLGDYVARPKSATVPWAGFLLALVGVGGRYRIQLLTAAVAIDVACDIFRFSTGEKLTAGNGPTIMLTVLILVAATRWSGTRRSTALHAAALGGLLIMASKVADTWLDITAFVSPRVLDPYVELADRALGNPSWLVGQLLEVTSPVGPAVLHWVYIELPVAAIVVAIWQLRNVTSGEWPRHYLVRTFLVLGLIGPIGYVLFPVVGPVLAYGPQGLGRQLGDYWPGVVPPLQLSPSPMLFDSFTPRNCMPSMHTAWVVAVFLHSRSGPQWLRWGGAFWLVGTLGATLGFGAHYGADLVAGAVLCLTVESALREPDRGLDRYRIRLVLGGSGVFAVLLLSYRFLAVQMAEYPVPFGVLVLGMFAGVAVNFYATWFAHPETALAQWGGRDSEGELSSVSLRGIVQ